MNHAFGIQLIHRTARMHFAGALGFFLFLSVTGSIALLGVACVASSFSLQRESTSEGSDANKFESPISISGNRRISRRHNAWRQTPPARRTETADDAINGVCRTRVWQRPPSFEHDRRNGFGAPLRC